jgi:hypothetical protein
MKRLSANPKGFRIKAKRLSMKSKVGSKRLSMMKVGKLKRGKREVWQVSAGGTIKNIATSASSTAAMDEAVMIYGRALKRLADL